MPFRIVRNDITEMDTEAIVNTASSDVTVGSGCDTAVYTAAGLDELLQYRREHIGIVPEGEAFITPGFMLKAKYIIHAVSPKYCGGDKGEEEKLRSCYRKSLQLALKNGISSIAFPLIATGSFGYPKEEGMRIAADEINTFLLKNDMDISLVVFDTKATMLGERIYPDLEAYIDHNYVVEARQAEYRDGYFGSVAPNAPGYSRYEAELRKLEDRMKRNAELRSQGLFRKSEATGLMPGIAGPGKDSRRKETPKTEAPHISNDADTIDIVESCTCAPELYEDFEERHEGRLEERMKHLSDTFSEYLLYLIRERKMENAEVWKRGIVDKKIFSKIKNNVNYHPTKLTALCLCVGARLNLDESRDLLARAGYALSPCDKTDIIFSYFIENEIYDMIELDIQLEEHGLPCIIT